jgi:hypothetical protein
VLGPAIVTVLFTPVVTVLAGPLSPGVNPTTTPGVLVRGGGGAAGVAGGGAAADAGITLVEVLQFVIGEEGGAGIFDAGGGAAAGVRAGAAAVDTIAVEFASGDATAVEFVGADSGELTVEPLSMDTAGCGGDGGGAEDMMVTEDVIALSLSVATADNGRLLADEFEELYAIADVCTTGPGAVRNSGIDEEVPEGLPGIDMVAKIGPLATLAVGNTGPKRPETNEDPEEVNKGAPFRAETAMVEAGD